MPENRTAPPLLLMDQNDVIAAGGDNIRLAMQDVAQAITLLKQGQAGMPAELSVPLDASAGPSAKAYALPAWLGGDYQTIGVKWTAHRQTRPPAEQAAVSTTLINCRLTGQKLGVVTSGLLTAIRTAAVSALVMQSMSFAHTPRIAVLGAGTIGAQHLRMATELFDHSAPILLWNRTAQKAHALAAHYPENLVRVVTDLGEIMRDADIVLACTAAQHPFILREHIHPGMLLIQAGYDEVTTQAITAFDHICVDLWGDFAQTSAKSLFRQYREGTLSRSDITADLGALVAGEWHPPLGESVYFSSFGLNIFDIALASRVIRSAQQGGQGGLPTPPMNHHK